MWLAGTANSARHPARGLPLGGRPAAEYSLAVSTDRGATWTTRPAPALGTRRGTGVWLTATDAKHLVAVRQGLASSTGAGDAPTTVLTSADGGPSLAARSGR